MSITSIPGRNAGRRLLPVLMLAPVIRFAPFRPADASEPRIQTRAWAIDHLRQATQGPSEAGTISALLYGLVMDYRQSKHPETKRAVVRVEVYPKAVEIEGLNCGALVDLRLDSSSSTSILPLPSQSWRK